MLGLLTLALLSGCASGAEVPTTLTAPKLELAIESSEGVLSATCVLVNVGPRCQPLWLDPTFAAEAPNVRPFVRLEFEIKSVPDGTPMTLKTMSPLRAAIKPVDLLLLDCGEITGVRIDLLKGPIWRYDLESGSYIGRVCAHSEFASFVARNEDFARRFFVERVQDSPLRALAVRDFSSCSDWNLFTVRAAE